MHVVPLPSVFSFIFFFPVHSFFFCFFFRPIKFAVPSLPDPLLYRPLILLRGSFHFSRPYPADPTRFALPADLLVLLCFLYLRVERKVPFLLLSLWYSMFLQGCYYVPSSLFVVP